MPGRSAKQCRDRYVNYLLEPQKKEPWKDEEDEIISNRLMNYISNNYQEDLSNPK